MEPAHPMLLDEKQLAHLGELTVILGQVDEIMVQTVGRLLEVDRTAANLIMGSSKIADNSAIWRASINNRTNDPDILWLVDHAVKESEGVSAGRNDFIHAVFSRSGYGYFMHRFFGQRFFGGSYFGSNSKLTARRVRQTKSRDFGDIDAVKLRAARLSCLVAHIDHLIQGKPADTSPWLERLAPTLPPRPPQGEAPLRAKGRRRRQKSSPA